MDKIRDSNCLPESLVSKIFSGRCVLFLGSGASLAAGAPSATSLTEKLSNKYLDGKHKDRSLAKVASYVEQKPGIGRRELLELVISQLKDLEVTEAHKKLINFPWASIFTTNYEELIEKSFEKTSREDSFVKLTKSTDIPKQELNKTLLVKLHGCISDPFSQEAPIVITEDDLANSEKNRKALLDLLKWQRYSHTFLFIGYSFGNPNLSKIWEEVLEELGDLSQWSFAVFPSSSEEQKNLWKNRRVKLLDCTFQEFVDYLMEWKEKKKFRIDNQDTFSKDLTAVRELLKAVVSLRERELDYDKEKLEYIVGRIGDELGLSNNDLEALKFSAWVLGIGKIGLPDRILNKPGALNEEEWESIKNYPKTGEWLLSKIPQFQREASIVRHHHEKWDGSGYPDGLKKEEIPLEARILAVGDTILSMLSPRSYRDELSLEETRSEIQNISGLHIDPEIADVALNLLERREVIDNILK